MEDFQGFTASLCGFDRNCAASSNERGRYQLMGLLYQYQEFECVWGGMG